VGISGTGRLRLPCRAGYAAMITRVPERHWDAHPIDRSGQGSVVALDEDQAPHRVHGAALPTSNLTVRPPGAFTAVTDEMIQPVLA
jgi:hypothetical protein